MGGNPNQEEGSSMTALVSVVGNVGTEPTLRTTPKSQVLSFTVASNHWKPGGEVTTWMKIELWGGRGERLSEIIKKGMQVTVHGTLFSEEYESKTGEKRTSIVVNASDVMIPKQQAAMGGQPKDITQPAPTGDVDLDKEIPF
jgi:single-strand DNA-binding protein